MATHSSTLAWKIPWMKEPHRLQSMGSQRVGHNWATSLFLFFKKNGIFVQWNFRQKNMNSSVQFSPSVTSDFCDPMECSAPGFPVHHQLPELAQTHIHPIGDTIQPSHPLSSPSPPALNVFQHRGHFKWVSSSHEVAKVFSFSISLTSEHPGLISFRMHWLDLLAVQGTLKNLLQHHSSKASILQLSTFFMVQLHIHPWLLEKP